MSSWPITCSAFGTSASTSLLSARLQGSTWMRSPISAASASKTSRRVPDSATVAPCSCNALAIAPPRPPVAPVTSAVLPERSNMLNPSRCDECVYIRGNTHGHAGGARGNTLDQAAEHLARTQLVKSRHSLACHEGDAFAPTY